MEVVAQERTWDRCSTETVRVLRRASVPGWAEAVVEKLSDCDLNMGLYIRLVPDTGTVLVEEGAKSWGGI